MLAWQLLEALAVFGTAATQKNNCVLAMLAWDYFFAVPVGVGYLT
jgi:hypothetical protein